MEQGRAGLSWLGAALISVVRSSAEVNCCGAEGKPLLRCVTGHKVRGEAWVEKLLTVNTEIKGWRARRERRKIVQRLLELSQTHGDLLVTPL